MSSSTLRWEDTVLRLDRRAGDEVHLTHGAPLPRGQQRTEPSEAEAGDEKVQSSSADFGRQGTHRHMEVELRSGNQMSQGTVPKLSSWAAVGTVA